MHINVKRTRAEAREAAASRTGSVDPDAWHCISVGPDLHGDFHDVKLISGGIRELGGTCGSTLWASSPALVKWLCYANQLPLILGRRILELGAGTGFVGLALCALGAGRVLCTDMPVQQQLLEANLAANPEHAGKVFWQPLVWGTLPQRAFSSCRYDLIVACDVLYDEEQMEPLASTLAALMLECGADALLALPDRTDFGYTCSPSDPEPLPDYEQLLLTIEQHLVAQAASLRVDRIGSVPPEISGALNSRIELLLLSLDVVESPRVLDAP